MSRDHNNIALKKRPAGRDEMNIAEFPIASLTHQRKTGADLESLSFSDYITGKNGKRVKREWEVSYNSQYGYPTPSAEDTVIALLELTKETNDFTDRKVNFSRYQVLKKMGCSLSKQYYQRLQDDLDALSGIRIKSKNAFWDKSKKKYVTISFGIIDDYALYGDALLSDDDNQTTLHFSIFRWNEVFFNSLKAGYIKYLDTDFYFSLDYPTTKKLFRLLDRRKYNADVVWFDLSMLAHEKLGMSRSYTAKWKIAEKLKKAHDELQAKGFLTGFEFKKEFDDNFGEKRWHIYYYFDLEVNGVEAITTPENKKETAYSALIREGIHEDRAAELIAKCPEDRLVKQLKYFNFLKSTKSPNISKNPAGYLYNAIKEDYAPPSDYQKWIEKQTKQAKLTKQNKQKQEKQQAVADQQSLQSTRYNERFAQLNDASKKSVIKRMIEILKVENTLILGKFMHETGNGQNLGSLSIAYQRMTESYRNRALDEIIGAES